MKKNIKYLVLIISIVIFSMSAVGCNMVAKTPEAIRKTAVAKVNKESITKGEVDDRIKPIIEQVKQQYGEDYEENEQVKDALNQQRSQVLEQLIAEKIIMQKAKEKKLIPSEEKLKEETDKQLAETKVWIKEQGLNEQQYKQLLEQRGLTEEELREEIKEGIIQKKVYDNVTKDIKVEDKEVKQEYDKYKTIKYTQKPNKMQLAHILVKTEDEAKDVKKRLGKGEKFADLAKELSEDPGSRDNGGQYTVPYVNSGFDETFMKAAFATPEGKISEPVQTNYGWHIINVIKKEEYPPKKYNDVKKDIEKELLSDKKDKAFEKSFEKWKAESKIKRYPEKL